MTATLTTPSPQLTRPRGNRVRRVIGGFGQALIVSGVVILLFVAYQLWGTGLIEDRSQQKLRDEIEAALPAEPGALRPAAPDPPAAGDAVAVIKIPRIGVEKAVVEGVSVSDLKKGPGHYPQTPLPGQPGNAAIAGHRTTYGAPFYRLDELQPGDEILVSTRQGSFSYAVRETKIVLPTAISVLDPTPDDRLTLTTCHPRFSAAKRLIVVASLTGPAAPPAPERPETEVMASSAGDDPGLSGERAKRGAAVAWGSATIVAATLAWLLARRVGRLVTYPLAAPVVLGLMFMFFEAFATLLPANA